MTPAWAWPLLILGLLGWIFAAVLATVIAAAVISARKTAAPGAALSPAPGAASTGPDLTQVTRWRAEL